MLASSSRYRKELLDRLNIEFTVSIPEVNEQHLQGESIEAYVERLSELKAEYTAHNKKDSLVIGSDQALECDKKILGKPANYENAIEQLSFMNNKVASFYTGLCVINTNTKKVVKNITRFDVTFRKLTSAEIVSYISKEKPYDCAGSFKSEKMGISLLKSMNGDDPTSLIGLPLIKLAELLRNEGIDIP